ncbi:MAG: DUF2306 domain-containing protein [Pseudomonadota bacterium]
MPTNDGAAATSWPERFLHGTGTLWFLVAVVGQFAFVVFILAYYGTRTAAGDYPGWNDKNLIMGYVEGDFWGNVSFGVHVLLAAVMTFGGIFQLIPAMRRHFPAVHRWNGRIFLAIAMILSFTGIGMTWLRGANLAVIAGAMTSINGLMIIVFGALTFRYAVARKIAIHERWAMRTFMVANGVWFFRLSIMAWVVLNQGPRWMNSTLSGPGDILVAGIAYFLPVISLEIYQAGKRSRSGGTKILTGLYVIAMTLLTAIGIFGAIAFMWLPDITS